jgi:hypothetical protein
VVCTQKSEREQSSGPICTGATASEHGNKFDFFYFDFLIIILEINPVKYFFFKSGRFEWRQSGATYEGVVLI